MCIPRDQPATEILRLTPKRTGFKALVVACWLCHVELRLYEDKVGKIYARRFWGLSSGDVGVLSTLFGWE